MFHNDSDKSTLPLNFLSGGGAMGELISSKDWSVTALGPMEKWPQSLRTTVSLCVASNFPISIAWGPQRIQIYNDGYWPICGDKHPNSLGQDFKECWFSAWPVIGESFEAAAAGETRFLTNQRMFLDRFGYLEETFFTFSFSPIRDESGKIGGLFHPVTELTQQTLAERRLNVIRDLSECAVNVKSIDDTLVLISKSLSQQVLDLPFTLIYLLDENGATGRLSAFTGVESASAMSPKLINVSDATGGWPLAEVVRSRKSIFVNDLQSRFANVSCGPYEELPSSAVVCPLNLPGLNYPFGILIAGISSRREYDSPYRAFYDLLGSAVTNLLINARAYEMERKKAEALAEIDRAKTIFFSNISHEFRTPLTLMVGPLEEVLALDGELSTSVRENLKLTYRNTHRLQKLVDTLLQFSRIEAGRIQASFQPTNIGSFTADLASSFRSAIEKTGISLHVDCRDLDEPVYVDPDMWEKIVLNLLSNAFKYTSEGTIAITIRELPSSIELSVADTGHGIPEKELEKIFERFYRIQNVKGRSSEGTGIGLSMVKELVKLHHGRIEVQSAVGEGSTFVVTIPRGKEHLSPDNIAESSRYEMSRSVEFYVEEANHWISSDVQQESYTALVDARRRTSSDGSVRGCVLLADDNADMRQYVDRLLSPSYDVISAADGVEAFEKALQYHPDVVVCDIVMPGMNGFGLLKKMQAEPSLRDIPLIFLSARAGEEAKVEGLDAGANDYLTKPFLAKEFLAKIDAQIKIATAKRETEHKLLNLFENTPAAIAVLTGPDHTFYLANPLYQRMFNKTSNELIGKTVREVWPEAERQNVFEIYDQVYETGIPFTASEFPVTFFSDETRNGYYNFVVHPVTDSRNTVSSLVVYVYDVTDQVEARRKIEESESYFRRMADSVPAVLWISIRNGYCSYLSQLWYDLTGQTTDEALGFGWLQAVHPDDRENARRIFLSANAAETTFDILCRLRYHDGTYKWAIDSGRPRFSSDGEFEGFVGSIVDVDRQKLAEEKLRASELRYRTIFELTPVSIWQEDFSFVKNELDELKRKRVTDIGSYFRQHDQQLRDLVQQVKIVDVNRATLALLEAASKEDVKKGLQQIFVEDTSGAFLKELEIIASGGGHFEFETTIQTLKGKRLEVLAHIDFPTNGDYENILVTIVDISTIRKAENVLKEAKLRLEDLVKERTIELQRSNEDLQQFAHVASHDLKEPIRKIQTFVNKIRVEFPQDLDGKLGQYLAKVDKSAQRMNAMVEGVLNYSTLHAAADFTETVDLNETFNEVREDLEIMINEKSATIIQCDDLPRVRGTAVLLHQLFYNLLYNSLKFSSVDRPVRVEIGCEIGNRAGRAHVKITIWDNGIGFEPTYKERIFETFTRLNPKDRFEGTGLGLSLCKKIVLRHGGRISADGKLNEGAVFTVELPIDGPQINHN